MDEYINKFHELSVGCNADEVDHKTFNCYREGLCQEINHEMVMYEFYTIDDIYCKVRWVEQWLQALTIQLFRSQD